jgi:hypothetical protein
MHNKYLSMQITAFVADKTAIGGKKQMFISKKGFLRRVISKRGQGGV